MGEKRVILGEPQVLTRATGQMKWPLAKMQKSYGWGNLRRWVIRNFGIYWFWYIYLTSKLIYSDTPVAVSKFLKSSLEKLAVDCWQMLFAKLFIFFLLLIWEDKYQPFRFVVRIKYAMSINKVFYARYFTKYLV